MAARRDISNLPESEQARIIRRRQQAKKYREKNPEATKRRRKRWRDNNLEYARAESLRWYHENKERAQSKNRKWLSANPEYHRDYHAQRYASDVQYRLRHRLRARLHSALKGYAPSFNKPGCAVEDLGCSLEELKVHLELQFRDGMSWSNHGEMWEIDHKKPLVLFDLTDRDQFLEACHYTNLQPLTRDENRSKGGRYTGQSTDQ